MVPERGRNPHFLKNILLGTDFSPASDAALPYAVQIAKCFGAKIHVVHVVFPELYEALPAEAGDSAIAQAKAHAEQRMDRLLSSTLPAGVACEGYVRTGEVWDEMAKLISEEKIDLVIGGTRGRRGITKMLLGSVAEEIFRLSPVPVLTVGPSAASVRIAPELRSILHPVDFSIHSTRSADYALRLAREFRSRLIWLYVVQPSAAEPSSRERLTRFFRDRLKEVLPPETSDWCPPQYRVEFGDATEKITRVAREVKADLIVMGIWGAGALARATTHVGNTAYRVVSDAQVPVLSVRGPSDEVPSGAEAYE